MDIARMPAEAFHPGEFLAEELEARGWSVVEFARLSRIPVKQISEIVSGRRSVGIRASMALSAAFDGMRPDYWYRLQESYDQWLESQVGCS